MLCAARKDWRFVVAGRIKEARRNGKERCGCFVSWRRTLEAKEGAREAILRNLIDLEGEGRGNVFIRRRKVLVLRRHLWGYPC